MSQNTTSSTRDFLPDNCFLYLEDGDNVTLDLMTDVNNFFYYPSNIDSLTNEL